MAKLKNDEKQSWYREWATEIKILLVLVGVVLFALIVMMASLRYGYDMRMNAPCDYFASSRLEELPMRCFSYYGITGVQDDK